MIKKCTPVAVVDDNEVILRILPGKKAASSWCHKHFPGKDMKTFCIFSRAHALRTFDRQIQFGLTDLHVIEALLWFGGVSKTCDLTHDFKSINVLKQDKCS